MNRCWAWWDVTQFARRGLSFYAERIRFLARHLRTRRGRLLGAGPALGRRHDLQAALTRLRYALCRGRLPSIGHAAAELNGRGRLRLPPTERNISDVALGDYRDFRLQPHHGFFKEHQHSLAALRTEALTHGHPSTFSTTQPCPRFGEKPRASKRALQPSGLL